MVTVENEAGVFFAKVGYYKGKEVIVTHHDGSMVWLENYPVNGDDGLILGCWVPSESVSYYTLEEKTKQKPNSNKKRHQKRNKEKCYLDRYSKLIGKSNRPLIYLSCLS